MVIYDFLQRNNIENESIENIKQHLSDNFSIDLESLEYLGSGNCGTAYVETGKKINKVVKITNDRKELIIAKSLCGKENKNIANIYGIFRINSSFSLIIQEKLDTESEILNETIYELMHIVNSRCEVFQEIIYSENIEDVLSKEDWSHLFLGIPCSEYGARIIESAYRADEEIREKTQYSSEDLHLFNLGLKSNGDLAFFDQRSSENFA